MNIQIVALLFFGTALIASQYYSLVFRIVAVLPSPNARRMFLSPACTVFLLALIASATALVGYGAYLITEPRTDFDFVLELLKEKEYLAADDAGVACFNFYAPHAFAVLASIAVAFAASQTFFGLCAVWAMMRLRRTTAQMSERTRQMQLQFVRLLLLQASAIKRCRPESCRHKNFTIDNEMVWFWCP
ncbi:hypothetical protein AAVH_21195 [Aphelenchoides avenae]|nr:hypothetical protein AAVH_21195 [Aphelenchus avenae]